MCMWLLAGREIIFCTQKYNFWQNYCNFDFDISDISLQYWLNVLRVIGEDGARDKDWLGASPVSYRHNFLDIIKSPDPYFHFIFV